MDIGLALLAHLGLQTKYWVDAFLTAIYFINHLPTPTLSKSTHSRCGICAKCLIFGTYPTPNQVWPHLSDVLNAIFFSTCYNTITNLQLYGKLWHIGLLIFYSSFTLISLSSSLLAQYSPPPSPSPLFHSLSFSLFPIALFSSHSWIWATIDFLSTITDLYPSSVFFPPFVRSLLSVLLAWVQLWVWLWFPIVIGVGVGLWVVGFSSLFYIPVNWSSPFVSSESRLFESILGARTLWVDFRFRERGPGEICARESRQE